MCDISGGDGAADGDRVHSGVGATDQSLPGYTCLATPLPHSLPLLQRDAAVSEVFKVSVPMVSVENRKL